MVLNYRAFEIAYARDVPMPLKALYENRYLFGLAPIRTTFPNKPFVVEIQYFRPINELNQQDVKRSRFAFAVNSDGFDMLVDLTEDDLPILQREYEAVDRIGLTLVDLLAALHRQEGQW